MKKSKLKEEKNENIYSVFFIYSVKIFIEKAENHNFF